MRVEDDFPGAAPEPPRQHAQPSLAGAVPPPGDEKQALSTFARLRVPIGGQEIELQQLDYVHGGISLLRLRIREGRRFTVFDIDPLTARAWGENMQRWADAQLPAADEAA